MGEWKNVEEIVGSLVTRRENQFDRQTGILSSLFYYLAPKERGAGKQSQGSADKNGNPYIAELIWRAYRSFCVGHVLWCHYSISISIDSLFLYLYISISISITISNIIYLQGTDAADGA